MNPITHCLTGWALPLPFQLDRRDRGWVVAASMAPDLDALGAVGDLVQRRPLDSFELFATYHHVLGHNVLFACLITVPCLFAARRRLLVGALGLFAVHVHFLARADRSVVAALRGRFGEPSARAAT